RPGRSLDAYLSGEEFLPGLAARAAEGTDLLVIEGVMGLFDDSAQPGCDGSTAGVARILDAPVVLVVDASAMSGSVAALVHGFATFDSELRIAGVVLNRVGSEGHEILLREALAPLGIPVLGAIPGDEKLVWRERHLGLVPVAEHPGGVRASLERLAEVISRAVDLDALTALARSAPARTVADPPSAKEVSRCRVAVCSGPAFSFVYPENLELFGQAGAELVLFDPLSAAGLPEGCGGLYAGGGFPEVFAEALGQNRPLLDDLRRRVAEGLVVWAECGGFMWLSESLDGSPMAGALEGVRVHMGERLTLGYRSATTRKPSFLGPSGTVFRGHEFHRSVADPPGDGLDLEGRFGAGRGGFVSPTLFASYLHQHLAAAPGLAERFVVASASVGQSSLARRGRPV
ncbi:MAG: cobyrinate a,c-diamide synthase, partial [Acidimicrobiales bacterium]